MKCQNGLLRIQKTLHHCYSRHHCYGNEKVLHRAVSACKGLGVWNATAVSSQLLWYRQLLLYLGTQRRWEADAMKQGYLGIKTYSKPFSPSLLQQLEKNVAFSRFNICTCQFIHPSMTWLLLHKPEWNKSLQWTAHFWREIFIEKHLLEKCLMGSSIIARYTSTKAWKFQTEAHLTPIFGFTMWLILPKHPAATAPLRPATSLQIQQHGIS